MLGWFNRLSELTEDWIFLMRRDGGQSAWPVITEDLINLPYRHVQFTIFACSLTEPLPPIQPKIPLKLRPFETAHLEAIRRIYLPSEANLCAQRLEKGHFGLVACFKEQVVGYAWGATDMTLERIEWPLPPDTILCTDAYTAPDFRGNGVQTALMLERLRLFQRMGYKKAVTYIELENEASRAVWRKVNARPITQLHFKRVGFWRQTIL